MEPNESLNSSGVLSKAVEAPQSFRITSTIENSTPVVNVVPPPVIAASPVSMAVPTPGTGTGTGMVMGTDGVMKKKRGRPRKYAPNGAVSVTMALSPMPISASVPLSGSGEFSAWKPARDKLPYNHIKKSHKFEYETPGEKIEYFVGANFTPHILTVNAGEDVMMKVMSFSQQDSRAICILSANGTISNVTLRQPTSCGGTLTYEGHFEILSLSGSYMATDSGGTKSRSGGMSVSLAGPDGRVFGGGLAGLLVAAGPVQVVIGSFILGHHQQEQKAKKHRIETPSVITTPTVNVISADDLKVSYGGIKPMMSSFAFPQDNSASPNAMQQGFRNSVTENKTCSPTQDSRELSQSNCEISS